MTPVAPLDIARVNAVDFVFAPNGGVGIFASANAVCPIEVLIGTHRCFAADKMVPLDSVAFYSSVDEFRGAMEDLENALEAKGLARLFRGVARAGLRVVREQEEAFAAVGRKPDAFMIREIEPGKDCAPGPDVPNYWPALWKRNEREAEQVQQ